MVYRGFTWNASVNEAIKIKRMLQAAIDADALHRWDVVGARHVIRQIDDFLEVTTDGPTPSHGLADA